MVAIPAWPRLLKFRLAASYVGSEIHLRELLDAGLVWPIRRTARSQLFDRHQLDSAIDAVALNGWPEPAKR